MRTLKKTLCLVLALAMMVGLCAVGASAVTVNDYKDKDQIPNMEAFATLTAIGVFQGDDTGNVHPNDALKRAEGATLAAKMHATAGSGVSSFTDMGAYAWAQPAVAFCEANGIINGYGDGTFGPGDPLSTVAFAKICLCALGWNAEKEGLVGPQWEINTIKLVNALDLADGIGNPQWSDPIPRWQAGQFCYNTLKATMVDYNNGLNFTVTTSDGTKVEVGTGASAVINNSYDYRNELHSDKDDTMQFCEQYFPLLKQKTNVADGTFGFKNNVWFMGETRVDHNLTAKKIIASEKASNILKTYDTGVAGVTGKALFTDGNAAVTTKLTTIVNGYTTTLDVAMNRSGVTPALTNFKGSTVYLVDTTAMDKEGYNIADELIVKQPLLAKVTKITEATAAADRYATLTVYNKEGGTSGVKYVTDKFAKNDFLLVYPRYTSFNNTTGIGEFATTGEGNILEATLCETAPGTLTKITTDKDGNAAALTVAGVSYSVGANAFLGPQTKPVASKADLYTLGTGLTAYVSNGYVMGLVTDAVAYGDYIFVIDTLANGSALGNTTYTVGSVDQSAVATEVIGANVKATEDTTKGIYAYSTMKDTWASKTEATGGAYTFKPTAMNTKFTLTKLDPTVATLASDIVADGNTVFVIRDVFGFKSYKGLSAVPTYKSEKLNGGLGVTAYALKPAYTGAHVAAVYVDVGSAPAENTTTATIYKLGDTYASKEVDGKTTVYNYDAIVDGKITTVASLSDAISTTGLVTPGYSNGYLASVTPATGLAMDQVAVKAGDAYEIKVDAGVITVNGVAYVLADDCVAYVFTSTRAPLETGAPVDVLAGVSGGFITMVKTPLKETIKTIYFIVSTKAG